MQTYIRYTRDDRTLIYISLFIGFKILNYISSNFYLFTFMNIVLFNPRAKHTRKLKWKIWERFISYLFVSSSIKNIKPRVSINLIINSVLCRSLVQISYNISINLISYIWNAKLTNYKFIIIATRWQHSPPNLGFDLNKLNTGQVLSGKPSPPPRVSSYLSPSFRFSPSPSTFTTR